MPTPPNVNVVVTVQVDWSQTQNVAENISTDAGTLLSKQTISSGTGVLQSDIVWHDSGQLSANETKEFDLTNLLQPCLGGFITRNLSGEARVIVIKNCTSGTNATLNVRATGSNNFTAPFDGTGNYNIQSLDQAIYTNYLDGYTVDGSNKVFQIKDNGSGVCYEIVIVSATGN